MTISKAIYQNKRFIFYSILLINLSFLINTSQSFAHNQHSTVISKAASISAEQRSRAENLTLQLNKQLSALDKTSNNADLTQLITIAEQRKELLLELIEIDPAEAIRVVRPNLNNHNIPAELNGLLEQVKKTEGILEVTHEDFENPADSRYRYQLKSGDKSYSVYFTGAPPVFIGGEHVIVNGLFLHTSTSDDNDGVFAIENDSDQNYIILADGGDGTTSTASAPALELSDTFGEQKTVVLVINFQDKPNEKPWTLNDVDNLVFGEVNDFFLENSFGQTWLAGDVFGWFTLAMDSTDCSKLSSLSTLADQAATDAGINLNNYARIVYFHTRNACGTNGTAQIGPVPSRAWINGRFELRTVAHELGHNLGLFHAGFLDCSDGVIGTDCNTYATGDTVDILGRTPTVGHFNAFQKERLGWLNYGDSPAITSVSADGSQWHQWHESCPQRRT